MTAFSKKSILFLFITIVFSSCLPGRTTTTNTKVSYAKGSPEGLEDISKGNYSASNVELSGGDWYFEDALIGSTDNDTKNGEKAIRIREKGFVRMNYDIMGVREIKIAYGAYKGDGDSEWELYISKNNGANWSLLDKRFQTEGSKLSFVQVAVNEPDKARFEIRKVSGGSSRMNIDDIAIITSTDIPVNASKATRDDNLALGNPSNATVKDENNYLMIKPQYVLSYSRERSSVNWVSWHLSTAWKGDIDRVDNFRPDNSLPSDWYKVQNSDYLGSGFDRGHLCPADDRDCTAADIESTFLLTNIIPQAPNNNRGAWADLEAYCRKVAEAGNELYIVAGVYGKAGIGTNGGKSFTLERNRIVSFDEEHFKARRGKDWDELVLYTERGMVRIRSLFYTDYKEIKDVLTKDLIKHKNKRIAENNRVITNTLQSSTVLIALGVVCSFSPIQILFHITNVYLEGDEEEAQLNILSEGTFYLLITCVIVFLGLGFMQYKKYKRLLKEMEILEKF